VRLNTHQFQVRSVRETHQRHFRGLVAVRSAIDAGYPHAGELRLHLLYVASGNGDVIDSRIGRAEQRRQRRPGQNTTHHALIVRLSAARPFRPRARRIASIAVVYCARVRISRGDMYHEEIAQLTARIVEAERPEKIILFGSYASGTATESSDVDLLVISRSTLPRREREVRLTRQLFGSGVPYDLLVLTPEEIEERLRRNGPFIREILSTGQVVYQRP